jgi:predicted GTPase
VDKPELIEGKEVLVVEDGPTLTHGNMPYGAGTIAAKRLGATEIVDPRPYAVGSIVKTFEEYPHLGAVLPALGYGKEQIKELEETINKTPCDAVLIGTPIDLRHVLWLNKPAARARYELKEIGTPTLEDILKQRFLK